jgi:hypothetical protein
LGYDQAISLENGGGIQNLRPSPPSPQCHLPHSHSERGEGHSPQTPTIGIRHGDPLFPIIFVLMEEGLGHYLKASVLDGSLKGLPLQNIQPAPSHSEFFYETLLLNNLRAQETAKLNFILIDFVDA